MAKKNKKSAPKPKKVSKKDLDALFQKNLRNARRREVRASKKIFTGITASSNLKPVDFVPEGRIIHDTTVHLPKKVLVPQVQVTTSETTFPDNEGDVAIRFTEPETVFEPPVQVNLPKSMTIWQRVKFWYYRNFLT